MIFLIRPPSPLDLTIRIFHLARVDIVSGRSPGPHPAIRKECPVVALQTAIAPLPLLHLSILMDHSADAMFAAITIDLSTVQASKAKRTFFLLIFQVHIKWNFLLVNELIQWKRTLCLPVRVDSIELTAWLGLQHLSQFDLSVLFHGRMNVVQVPKCYFFLHQGFRIFI